MATRLPPNASQAAAQLHYRRPKHFRITLAGSNRGPATNETITSCESRYRSRGDRKRGALPSGALIYEGDHLMPLSLGDAPWDERNLWPEDRVDAARKDKVKGRLHHLVCSHRMPLHDAQAVLLERHLVGRREGANHATSSLCHQRSHHHDSKSLNGKLPRR